MTKCVNETVHIRRFAVKVYIVVEWEWPGSEKARILISMAVKSWCDPV
jgi:hypothetical protein